MTSRLLFAVVLLFVSLAARAACPYEWSTRTYSNTALTATGYKSSKTAACQASRDSAQAANASCGGAGQPICLGYSFEVLGDDGTPASGTCRVIETHPTYGPSTLYQSSFVYRESVCAPQGCGPDIGTSKWVNVTQAWSTSGDPATAKTDYKADGSPAGSSNDYAALPPVLCVGGCKASFSGTVADLGDAWLSVSPTASGLFRMSQDIRVDVGNVACTATDAEKSMLDTAKAAPACDGSTGYLNGKLTCIPKAKGTVNAVAAAGSKLGNPAAGSAGGKASDGKNGIPPTGGDGSNKGGPVTPKDGSKAFGDGTVLTPTVTTPPTGTVTAPAPGSEQAACGAPGQPRCGIDETGTPKGDGFGSGEKDKLGSDWTKLDEKLADITRKDNKDTTWAMPSWITSGACQPFNLAVFPGVGEFVIDLCPYWDTITGVANFFWALATFVACVGMVRSVTMGRSEV